MIKGLIVWFCLCFCIAGCVPITAPIPAATAKPTPSPAPQAEDATVAQAGQVTYYTMDLNGTPLDYAVVLPDGFDASQTYPILLSLPPGGQTKEMVDAVLDGYWSAEASRRGWIVISPVAPGGKLFFEGSETLIPEFLARTAQQYPPEGGKYHLSGVSNGGISSFRVAVNHPELVHSILVAPGYAKPEDTPKLNVLKDIPIAMFVGEQDTQWVQSMQATKDELDRLGIQASLTILPNEGHVLRSLTGDQLFDLLDSFRLEQSTQDK